MEKAKTYNSAIRLGITWSVRARSDEECILSKKGWPNSLLDGWVRKGTVYCLNIYQYPEAHIRPRESPEASSDLISSLLFTGIILYKLFSTYHSRVPIIRLRFSLCLRLGSLSLGGHSALYLSILRRVLTCRMS